MRFSKEQKIIHHLMLKSFDIKDVGLFNGKIGLVIFFFHYAKYQHNPIYEDLANDLLDEVTENIHKELPLNFASGLCGIAWGIEYLIRNNFIEGNSNDICEELDKRIMSYDPRHLYDNSFETGLEGVVHYALARINGAIKQNNPNPFDSLYINDLIYASKRSLDSEKYRELNNVFQLLISCVEEKVYSEYHFNINNIIDNQNLINGKDVHSAPLGLRNGLSGLLLNRII